MAPFAASQVQDVRHLFVIRSDTALALPFYLAIHELEHHVAQPLGLVAVVRHVEHGHARLLLDRAEQRAKRLGVRLRTQLTQFPEGLAELPPADLVWSAQVVHHVGDQQRPTRDGQDQEVADHRSHPTSIACLEPDEAVIRDQAPLAARTLS